MFSVQKSRIKCHYCGKFGHFKRECRYGSTAASSGASNQRYREYRTPSPKLRRHPVVPFPVGSSISSDKCHYAFRGGKSKLPFFLAEANLSCNVGKDACIVDTAASNHFTNNKDLFINFVDVVNENMVLAVNGVEFPIEGKGDGLYYAYVDIEPKYASNIEKTFKIEGKPNDLMTWHERFGNANVDYILKTSLLDAVRGLPKLKRQLNFECESCRLNKYKRVSFQSIECTRSKAPLYLLHCDVWGPANVIGNRGIKYYLSVLDDYSRRMFIFPICHKSDTYDTLTKFIIRAERQLGLKVKAICSDIGGEFIASILTDFFVERGIKHGKTNIYTPQQIGASERLNGTVIDGARTVLSESGLDKSFWPEAILYVVHVWNRLCHSGQNLTPIELYTGIKPSIRHLRPFGSTLYVGTSRPLRGKLDPKAKKGILIGFTLGTRGYRVWIPEDSKVIETSNVRFQKPQQWSGASAPSFEVDPIFNDEFVKWRQNPNLDKETAFMKRIYEEDIKACLYFRNTELSELVLSAIEEDKITIEKISVAKHEPLPKTCDLMNAPRLCPYKMYLGGKNSYNISALSRNRITAICDLFCYLRYIQKGLITLRIHEVYLEILKKRRRISSAKLGLIDDIIE
ncbi:retrovirus-related Pol polyprotein from transposon TNT 1-94 [Trichonephila clavata]|uniref:Retrovirus-related Pol polyprotein from transposon TNT 1-94 n=1 Tax=Trichonephila clavata TaxID=2740835 RepID=A0A8X6GC12_TRICU|nr:retrovirus-related Pol polyprotein from transposon TNT 1-94 [Trichonephila clavata]